MLAVAFHFLAGRYHATPWGRHVNEADVAWPPDPWRIVRALIAVWHRKLDPRVFGIERLHRLLATLAEAAPPSYRLPDVAIHSHTRHYMPGRQDKKVLVFDAFARVDPADPLIVGWPELHVDAVDGELLDALLSSLGVLGRAESWVEARRLDHAGPLPCAPLASFADAADSGEIDGDIVRLLAPQSPADYATFRTARLAAAQVVLDAAGEPRGKQPADKRKLIRTLPNDWLDAIGVETAELQSAGWSAPPAATDLRYVRPRDALRATAPRLLLRRVASSGRARPTTARFKLYGKPLPRLTDAVRVGESARRAAMGKARRLLGEDALPPELSGHVAADDNRHGHAFWLPEDADGDGAIDHLFVHAPAGFGDAALRVLRALRHIKCDADEPLAVMLEAVDECPPFAAGSKYARTACIWRSVTPYLHPWHLKAPDLKSDAATHDAIEHQLRREWQLRGAAQPALLSVQACGGGGARQPVHFRRTRSKRGLSQPDRLGRMVELQFAAPVRGPVALGFGCHFGLGLFEPVPDCRDP